MMNIFLLSECRTNYSNWLSSACVSFSLSFSLYCNADVLETNWFNFKLNFVIKILNVCALLLYAHTHKQTNIIY